MEERREFDAVFLEKLDRIVEQNKAQSKLIEKMNKTIHNDGNGLVVRITRGEEQRKQIFSTLKIHWGLYFIMFGAVIKLVFF